MVHSLLCWGRGESFVIKGFCMYPLIAVYNTLLLRVTPNCLVVQTAVHFTRERDGLEHVRVRTCNDKWENEVRRFTMEK